MRWLLWVVVFFIACSLPAFDLKLAPHVTHVEELAFSVSYPSDPKPVLCRTLQASSEAWGAELHQKEWEARAPKPVPCPNPLKWGQDLGAGWELVTAAKPLERNRRYELMLHSDKGRREWLQFCVFQNGSVIVNYYAYQTTEPEKERMAQCMKEGHERPVVEKD